MTIHGFDDGSSRIDIHQDARRPIRTPRVSRTGRMLAVLVALLAGWLGPTPGGEPAHAQSTQDSNIWPFPGFSDAQIRDYMDERVTVLAINRLRGRAILTLEGVDRPVEVPLSMIEYPQGLEVLPIVEIFNSREDALRGVEKYEPMRTEGRYTPVAFYRDAAGIIWPTVINAQTAPRLMATYPRALDAARAEERATRDAFINLAFWHLGARYPARASTSSTSTSTSSSAARGSNSASAARGSSGSAAKGSSSAGATQGTQSGRLIIAKGRELSEAEMEIAQKLASEGRTVKALVESTEDGVKSADFLVDGVKTELKTVSKVTAQDGDKMATVVKRTIEYGKRQAPHIIVDVRGQARMTAEIARKTAERTLGADKERRRIQQIRMIGKDFDLTFVPKPR